MLIPVQSRVISYAPAAETMARNILRYVAAWQAPPRRNAVYVGTESGKQHLKASGIFARLNLRDRKPAYLLDIPRTLGYIVDLVPDYPELADLGALIRDRILPVLAQRQ